MTKMIAKWLALALIAALTLSGCGLVTINKTADQAAVTQATAQPAETASAEQAATADVAAVDGSQVVAEYAGGTVTYDEAIKEYQNWLSYYEAYGFALTNESDLKDLKQQVLDTLVQQRIIQEKATEMGLTNLSEDAEKAIQEKANAEYEDAISYYMGYLQGDTDEETRQNAIDYLNSIDYSLDSILEYAKEDAWQEALRTQITKDVSVTDEAVKAAYDASVEEDKQTFTEDTFNFENAATYGDTITWAPEGYRAVKHILLTLPDEDSVSLADLESQIEDVNVRIEEMKNPDAAEGQEEGDASALEGDDAADAAATDAAATDAAATDAVATDAAATDAVAAEATPAVEAATTDEAAADATVTEAPASEEGDFGEDEEFSEDDTADQPSEESVALDNLTLPELQAKLSDLQTQLDALKAASMEKLRPKLDEIQAKITAGEDFEKLIEAYGEDDGMKTEPTKTNGYYVSENSQMWDDAFTTAAMALQKVGDVSQPVLSQSGVHIIKYIGDVTPGPVPLETIKDVIRDQALEQAKSDLYDQTVNGWVAAAGAKTYVDRLVDETPAG
jgi:parvulin-like peptidyl-prolyl isomerase